MNRKTLLIGSNGYIGSLVSIKLFEPEFYNGGNNSIELIDISKDNPTYLDFSNINYLDLTKREVSKFDNIIFLAGNSAVNNSIDTESTIYQNIVGLHRLFDLIDQDQKLIYASSGSLCDGMYDAKEYYTQGQSLNNYDLSKKICESIHKKYYSNKQIFGLRFGTVFGSSPNFRDDTIINKLYLKMVKKEKITIVNSKSSRTFLNIDSIPQLIVDILERGNVNNSGIYNVGDFSCTFAEVGNECARRIGKDLVEISPIESKGYDFTMNTEKVENAFDFKKKTVNIEQAFDIMFLSKPERSPFISGR